MPGPHTTAGLVALGVMAIASGCTVWADDEPRFRSAVVVSQRTGEVLGIRLGDDERAVRRVLGKPVHGEGYVPLDEEYRGPVAIPGGPGTILRYQEFAFLLAGSGIRSFMVTLDGAKTRRGVAIGDDLDDVREKYAAVRCGEASAGESLLGRPIEYPWCRARVGRNAVFFGDDPIASITVTRIG